jgi:hypothetical protein
MMELKSFEDKLHELIKQLERKSDEINQEKYEFFGEDRAYSNGEIAGLVYAHELISDLCRKVLDR